MKLKKLRSKTALIQVVKTEKSSVGVYFADENIAKEVAKVIQVADDITEFKVGDKILFKTWAPNYYKVDGEEFAILDEEHFDGVL